MDSFLNLCCATILKLEKSGGIVTISKKHWSPGGDLDLSRFAHSWERGAIAVEDYLT